MIAPPLITPSQITISLHYCRWKVYCSVTGMLMFESAAGPESSFRIKSTPPVCYDRVECVAEDTVLPLCGSDSVSIASVTGK